MGSATLLLWRLTAHLSPYNDCNPTTKSQQLCAQKMEELAAQQQAEKAKMMACTVTILESSSSSSAAAAGSSFQPAAERRGLGTFTFTLDEDF
jgi:hypothetical protein